MTSLNSDDEAQPVEKGGYCLLVGSDLARELLFVRSDLSDITFFCSNAPDASE